MKAELQFRAAGCIVAALVGVGVPIFLLGPYVFNSYSAGPSTSVLWGAAIAAVFGIWLLIVSVAAEKDVIEEVVQSLGGSEVFLLLLPYFLVLGSVSVLKKMFRRQIY